MELKQISTFGNTGWMLDSGGDKSVAGKYSGIDAQNVGTSGAPASVDLLHPGLSVPYDARTSMKHNAAAAAMDLATAIVPDKLYVSLKTDLPNNVKSIAKHWADALTPINEKPGFGARLAGWLIAGFLSPFIAVFELGKGVGLDVVDVAVAPVFFIKDNADMGIDVYRAQPPKRANHSEVKE